MKSLYFIFLLIACASYAQTNNFLALQHKKAKGEKLVKFYCGDKICLKTSLTNKQQKGIITSLSDTSLTLDSTRVILYKSITKLLVDNSTFVTRSVARFLIGCGIGFVTIDTFNNLINGDSPAVKPISVGISAGLVLVGEAINLLTIKRYKMSKKNKLIFIKDAV